MNRDEIERRLRRGHPIESLYGEQLARPRVRLSRRPGLRRYPSVWVIPAVLALGAVVLLVRLPRTSPSGALPEGSNGASGPEPTKAVASLAADTPAPVSVAAACTAGRVRASIVGWGGAMGTEYAVIKLEPTGSACSLPISPTVSVADNAGAKVATSSTSTIPGQGARVDLGSAALEARVGVVSLCGASLSKGLTVALDFGLGTVVTVALPAGFSAPCSGGSSQVFVDDLFPAP